MARKPCGDSACIHGQQKVERDSDPSLPVSHRSSRVLAPPGRNGYSLLRSLRFHLKPKGENPQVDGKFLNAPLYFHMFQML